MTYRFDQELIERGASGDVMNRTNMPAVTVVNQYYESLGDLMLDKWVFVGQIVAS